MSQVITDPRGGHPNPAHAQRYHRPLESIGQLITFAVVVDRDEHFTRYTFIHAKPGDTIARIAARRGQPEEAQSIAKLNGIRHVYKKLRSGQKVRLPGTMRQKDAVNVLADDPPPKVMGGFAKYDTVDLPQRKGITRFLGYDPYTLDIPVQWEEYKNRMGPDAGSVAEQQIWQLQRWAGRGDYQGAGEGPPAVIRVSVTNHKGLVVPLLPRDFQWMPGAPSPLYRISGIAMGDGALRAGKENPGAMGRRVRQKCVISVVEFTPMNVPNRSASSRSRSRNPKGGH